MTPLSNNQPDTIIIEDLRRPEMPTLDKKAKFRFQNHLFQATLEKHLTTDAQTARLGDYKMDMFDVFSSCKFSKVAKKTIKLAYDIIKIAPFETEVICRDLEKLKNCDLFYTHVFSATRQLVELQASGAIEKKDSFMDKAQTSLMVYFENRHYDKALTLAYFLDLSSTICAFGDILDNQGKLPDKLVESFSYFLFICTALKRKKIGHEQDLRSWVYKEIASSVKRAQDAKNDEICKKLISLIPTPDLSLLWARLAKKYGMRVLLRLKPLISIETTAHASLKTWIEEKTGEFFIKALKNHDTKDFVSLCNESPFEEIKESLDAFVLLKDNYPIKIVRACAFILESSKRVLDEFLSYQIKIWVQRTGEGYGFHLKL